MANNDTSVAKIFFNDIAKSPVISDIYPPLFTKDFILTRLDALNRSPAISTSEASNITAEKLFESFSKIEESTENLEELELKNEKPFEIGEVASLGAMITHEICDTDANDTRMSVDISEDRKHAYIMLHHPTDEKHPLTYKEMISILNQNKVVGNIRKDYLLRLELRPVYEHSFKIATATEPVLGEDGRIIYYFDKDQNLKPKENEDGTVDYKSLLDTCSAVPDQLLAEIVPPTPSRDGTDVCGNTFAGPRVKAANIVCGSNTRMSDDHRKIYATCEGQISISGDRISVNRQMTVANVDNQTGNILFSGDVMVLGDIRTGFSVHAGGNIIVKGSVESATLIAGGNIILYNGINCKDGGTIKAGGSFKAKFIENCTITAVNDIVADSVLNSNLTCEGEVTLSGRRGSLIGGSCCAGAGIYANNIGNESNISTSVSLNILPKLERELKDVQSSLKEYTTAKLHLQGMFQALYNGNNLREELKPILLQLVFMHCRICNASAPVNAKKEMLEKRIKNLSAGAIVVKNQLYGNVTIDINGTIEKNLTLRTFCHVSVSDKHLVFSSANSSYFSR